ncbi:MAG: tRNA (adenosine(37)-N6)-threonylcarbamoyltransferase complex transferase subunit TsaD [Clostridia bacterium]|nr:tRNA (adenosine(37)-N6)-threonylcarbamoyltransferase complex transferase subunit TsaD [Clostridia bacterium]
MFILGFESSCDETSAAVVEEVGGRLFVRSNIVASQIPVHRLYGGVVPEIASRAHVEVISRITGEALSGAGIALSDVGLIAVTDHPGLIGALLVAVNFAKGLASANGIPLVGVDHIRGHIAASYLAGEGPVPEPPFLALALSGGHTSIYRVHGYTEWETVGSTRDDAIGEAFDKIGRLIGLEYPAGAAFDKLAAEGFREATGTDAPSLARYEASPAGRDPTMKLPSPALPGDTLDFSFSGLKTAAINLLHHLEQTGGELPRALFAARYTALSVGAVTKKIGMALDRYPGLPVVAAGGVAANSHLRRELTALAARRGVGLFIPPLPLCGDNAAMIAAQGYHEYLAGNLRDSSLNASASDD